MTTSIYQRPTGSKATSIGDRNRRRFSRHLRRRIFELLRPVDFLVAEETIITDAVHRQLKSSRDDPWQDRPKWVTTRLRTDQMALIGLLQKRHLKATGKEISKAEVLAALMATSLEHILDQPDFSGKPLISMQETRTSPTETPQEIEKGTKQ